MRHSYAKLAAILPFALLIFGACNDDEAPNAVQGFSLVTTTSLEAEDLGRTSSQDTKVTTGDCENSNCAYVEFKNADDIFFDDWIELTLPNLAAATYSVRLVYKANDNRGIVRASLDGKAFGASCDEYTETPQHQATCELGRVTMLAGSHKLRFTVVDLNDASWGFAMTLDKIVLSSENSDKSDAGRADASADVAADAKVDATRPADVGSARLDAKTTDTHLTDAFVADSRFADSHLADSHVADASADRGPDADAASSRDVGLSLDAGSSLDGAGPPPPVCRCFGKPLPTCTPTGHMTYTLARAANPTPDQASAYASITCGMDGAIAYYNCNTSLSGHISVAYNPGVPTAQASYRGQIAFGKNRSYMACPTAMHEMGHYFGVGTHWKWKTYTGANNIWTGTAATEEMRLVTSNPNAVVHISGVHFWPYGLNYASEVKSTTDLVDHTLIVSALRRDMGL